jgi:hypothetical protein
VAPANASRWRHSTGASDGSIIAGVITIHMARNETATRAHVCPGIRIHAIDIVQPPGIGIPPIADIEEHQTTVAVALAANNSAQTARTVCSVVRSQPLRRETVSPAAITIVSFRIPVVLVSGRSLSDGALPCHE